MSLLNSMTIEDTSGVPAPEPTENFIKLVTAHAEAIFSKLPPGGCIPCEVITCAGCGPDVKREASPDRYKIVLASPNSDYPQLALQMLLELPHIFFDSNCNKLNNSGIVESLTRAFCINAMCCLNSKNTQVASITGNTHIDFAAFAFVQDVQVADANLKLHLQNGNWSPLSAHLSQSAIHQSHSPNNAELNWLCGRMLATRFLHWPSLVGIGGDWQVALSAGDKIFIGR